MSFVTELSPEKDGILGNKWILKHPLQFKIINVVKAAEQFALLENGNYENKNSFNVSWVLNDQHERHCFSENGEAIRAI